MPAEPSPNCAGGPTAAAAALPEEVALALAVAALPEAGPARRLALHRAGSLSATWRRLCAGRIVDVPAVAASMGADRRRLVQRWRSAASAIDPTELARRHVAAGVGVVVLGQPAYPDRLAADLMPPTLLCVAGDLDVLARPRVAIVGTRRATRYGRDVAFELGRALALAGVGVVSGLALGIDGAAHRGALSVDAAPPIAVVGSGLDIVYPVGHTELWAQVASRGVILSEHVLGTPPRAWHFPCRNRILAALADLVVVVESPHRGGSMHTVEEALARDVPLLAVPGPVTSAASAGTNALLADGAGVAGGIDDVLVALGLSAAADQGGEHRPAPDALGSAILDALGWQPALLDQLLIRVGCSVAEAAAGLERLEAGGWIAREGPWIERRSHPSAAS